MPCLHQHTSYYVELCVAVSCSHDNTIQHCPSTGCICNPATAACCWHAAAAADRLLLKCASPGGLLLLTAVSFCRHPHWRYCCCCCRGCCLLCCSLQQEVLVQLPAPLAAEAPSHAPSCCSAGAHNTPGFWPSSQTKVPSVTSMSAQCQHSSKMS